MTGDIRIDALLYDQLGLANGLPHGTPLTVSYRFMDNLNTPEGQAPFRSTIHDFMPMSEVQRQVVRSLLDTKFNAVGVRFNEVGANEPAMLRFGLSSGINGEGANAFEAGYASFTTPGGMEPIVLINYLQPVFQRDPAGHAFEDVMLHEVGHALGMKHPGKYHAHEQGPFLPAELDHTGNTIMSYNYQRGSGPVDELRPFDLLALQHVYGVNASDPYGPVVRQLEGTGYFHIGSAIDDILYFAPGPRQEFARTIETSWGNDRLHVDVNAMDAWDLVVFRGGHGLDTLVLNAQLAGARAMAWEDNGGTFYLLDGFEQRHFELDSVERVVFADQAVALDTEQGAGEAYRLYKAAFAREPDQPGVGYWINELDQGMPLIEIAASFLDSDEFTLRYGTGLDNTAFVDAIYLNVLARQPDPAGHAYWLNELNNGIQRQQFLVNVSESPENKAGVAELIGEGIIYDLWLV